MSSYSEVSEAVDKAVAAQAESPSESTASSSPAGATTPPSASRSEASPPSPSGPAPAKQGDEDADLQDNDTWMSLDKRRQVIANHRKKERDTVTKEWRDRLGFDPTDHEIEHFRALRSDGKSYAVALAKAYGLSVSEATEVARRTSAPVTPATWTPPQPSLQAEDGRPAYTADEVNAIVEHRLGELRAQIEPITRQFSDLTAKEQQAEIGRRADATVKDMQTWPHFETLKPAIVERVKRSWNGQTFALSFDAAYRQAFADYLPTLEQQSREKVLAELKQRPAVPEQVTSSTPARSGGAKTGKGGLSIDDAWDKAVAKHGGSVRF